MTHTQGSKAGKGNEGEIPAKFKHPQPFGFWESRGAEKSVRRGRKGRKSWQHELKKIVHTQRAPRVSNTTNNIPHPNGQTDRQRDEQTGRFEAKTKLCLMSLQ